MKVLAIDTASEICAACVYEADGAQVLARRSIIIGRGHAEQLLGLIDEVIDEAQLNYEDLEKIAVCVGPGSFTGIRVGVSAARGMALALTIPSAGVTTLQAIAADQEVDGPFAVAIQAGRGQAYVQSFDRHAKPIDEPIAVDLEKDAAHLIHDSVQMIVGNAAKLIDADRSLDCHAGSTGNIETIAKLGANSSLPAKPIYIRAADAKIAEGFALQRKSGSSI